MLPLPASLDVARVKRTYLSPTRTNNPQPLGLVYQSPLHPNAKYVAIWDHTSTMRKTASRFPQFAKHLEKVNFSCGKYEKIWPSDRIRQLPTINYSLQTTNRDSYRNPLKYNTCACVPDMLRGKSCKPIGAAMGIVPRILSRAVRKSTPSKSSPLPSISYKYTDSKQKIRYFENMQDEIRK